MEGEVEIVKMNMSKVLYNPKIGVVGINEDKVQGKIIRSKPIKKTINFTSDVPAQARYSGSNLYIKTQEYLSRILDCSKSFKDI